MSTIVYHVNYRLSSRVKLNGNVLVLDCLISSQTLARTKSNPTLNMHYILLGTLQLNIKSVHAN